MKNLRTVRLSAFGSAFGSIILWTRFLNPMVDVIGILIIFAYMRDFVRF